MKDRNFARFVLPNVLAMVGTSCYVIADTYFISVAEGSDGIAALNLVLPLYGLLFALGSMTGTGSATRFALLNATGNAEGRDYFFNSVFWSVCLSFPFLVAGIFFPDKVLQLLGADGNLVMLGKDYTRIVLCFSPFFIVNYTFTAFVRNSGSPGIAMAATVVSGAFNIAADYVFMFPFGMGMGGAALATGISPVISIVICLTGLLKKRDLFRLSFRCVSFVKLIKSWSLGVSAFVGEISVSLTTLIFNFILLGLAGNTAVAAYGVISNTALVVTAMLNGVSQGMQPVASGYFGKGEDKALKSVYVKTLSLSVAIGALSLIVVGAAAESVVALFNTEGSAALAEIAEPGIRLYFVGFLFAAVNVANAGFYSATGRGADASAISVSRGFICISVAALVLSETLGIVGVWLSFAVAEIAAFVIGIAFSALKKKIGRKRSVSV